MEAEGKRARGHPRRRWMELVKEDMAEKKLKTQDAANRPRWRTLTKHNIMWEKSGKEEEYLKDSS
jgi:hypothetical protein